MRAATVLSWTGNLLLAVGVVVAHAAVLAVVLTALFARRHLGAAADVMAWAGWCLGTAAACFWLRRQLGGDQRP
ncbi:hypothetical protein ABT369_53185 [Dactylosporangium sp. NPDC000244]|uniref:hypothetical protein n=1 Tax=Dactylosporangium sp. NPDC000244 TaxID=3154365 RepID=UPI0033241649